MPETDFPTQLARLAPEVDEAAAKDVFERHRRTSGAPRWLLPAAVVVLIVAGVTGLVLLDGEDATAPVSPVDTTSPVESDAALRPSPGETLIAGEEHFDVITVEQTTVGFGNAELAGSTDDLAALWAEWNPGVDQPTVDFGSNVALVITRPDNACADVVTRFDVTNPDGVATWTPVLEELADVCGDPLLSWLYVVAIDRAALGDRADIAVPAAEPYDVPEQTIEYTAPEEAPVESTGPSTVTLTPTDVVVPLPPVGEPALHNTGVGMFWVVQHDGGDVSVIPATIDRRTTEDDGVSMLQSLVVASETGGSFLADGDIWDAWGRAATAGRSADLVGYAGRVVGDDVDVLYSDATHIEGEPQVPDGEAYELPTFETITPEQFIALSSSGPIWRPFDAELVVENGVGRICDVDTSVPVDQLEACDESSIVLDTQITSTNPEITTWFESPILAFQDPLRGFTSVIPLGGSMSLNMGAVDGPAESVVTSIEITCGRVEGVPFVALVGLDLPSGESRTLTVVDGDEEYGKGTASGSGAMTIGFGLLAPPPESAELVVSEAGVEEARIPIPPDRPTDCSANDTEVWEPPLSSGPGDDVSFRVVSRPIGGGGGDWIGWATDQAQLDTLLTQFDRVGTGDPIDFESEIALVVSIGHDSCGPFFDGLDLMEDRIQVRTITNDGDGCRTPLIQETAVLALPRSELSGTTAVATDSSSDRTVVEFATDSGRFVALRNDGFEINGADIECDNLPTSQLTLALRGYGDGVTSITAEVRIGDRWLTDVTYPPSNPSEGVTGARVVIPDDIDLTQPIAFTVRPNGSAENVLLSPPIAIGTFGEIPNSCP